MLVGIPRCITGLCKFAGHRGCSLDRIPLGSVTSRKGQVPRGVAAHRTSVAMANVCNSITLTEEEEKLFQTLLDAVDHAGMGTVLRCAGGWVRDKLLGKDSKDIDIALDNMLGKDFAEKVNDYLKAQGREQGKLAVIISNPEQSKHLETARLKIDNIEIDLVNLRSETYADGSRIPKMEFGTPVQDAYRRDFTINSMFYNINERVVEDFTEKGMDDLRAGIIRTPLPPQETFKDDPLRVLRAVRFGTRFNFQLESSIMVAASSVEVREALSQKVSKERVGTELDGMFNGPSPSQAMRLLHRMCLFSAVFALPPQFRSLMTEDSVGKCVGLMEASERIMKAMEEEVVLDKDDRRALLLSALLFPLRLLNGGKASKPLPVTTTIIKESLKWRVKDMESVALLHEVVPQMYQCFMQLTAEGEPGTAGYDVRIALGHCIRRMKRQWQLGVMLMPLMEMKAAAPLGEGDQTSTEDVGDDEHRLKMVRTLLSAIHAFDLTDCWQWKPLMDGKMVMQFLGLTKPGPLLGVLLSAVMDWQLAHPQGQLEACKEHLKRAYDEHQASQAAG